jgi:hypothetical protein
MKNSGPIKSDFLLYAFLIFQNFSVNSMFFLWNFLEKTSITKLTVNKGHGSKQYFYSKKSKSIMRLEPWPSSLSCQRYNQQSFFCLLIWSIIKRNEIIFVLAAPHICCVIIETKKSEICCESVIHTFLHRLFCLKTGFFCQFNILAS